MQLLSIIDLARQNDRNIVFFTYETHLYFLRGDFVMLKTPTDSFHSTFLNPNATEKFFEKYGQFIGSCNPGHIPCELHRYPTEVREFFIMAESMSQNLHKSHHFYDPKKLSTE